MPFAVKLPGQQAVRGIRGPQQFLQIVRIGADQIDVKRPFAVGIKTPIVEIECKFQIRGRPAAARAASLDMQFDPASR